MFSLIIGDEELVMPGEPSEPCEENKNLQKNMAEPNTTNFDNCKHRSVTEEKYFVPRGNCPCQGQDEKVGWVCHKLDIKSLSSEICKDCGLFKQK